MATRTATAKVAIDGEKEYKQALQELNTGSRTLGTEMKKLQSEFKGQEQSTEFLTKKGELLERQLLQQKDKVQTLREAVARSAEAYGEADSRTQAWIQKLNLAEAEEYDLTRSVQDTTKAVDDQGEKMENLGDTVQNLAGKLGVQLPQGATKALNGMQGLSSGTVAAMTAAVAAVATVIKTVKELQQTTIDAANRADEIMTRSIQMNISAQQLQALQFASPFVDVDVDTMASSLSKLTQVIAEAASGSESAQAKFKDLGVSVTDADGSLRSAYDVWMDTMDALAGMTNETERDAAAMDLLGKSGQQLAPIYRNGTDALREYTAAAEENYIMSDDQLEALGRVDDAVQKLTLTQEANKNMIAVQWAPTAEKALNTMSDLFEAAGKALVDSGIIKGFGELVQFGTSLIEPITSLLESADSAPGRLKPVYEILHGIAGVFAWIADAGNVVAGILSLDFNRIGTALGFGKSTGNYSNLQRWQGYGNMDGWAYDQTTGKYVANGFNATGNDNWRGGLTWVGESGPELVSLPRGSQILNAQESRSAGGDTFYITIDAKSVKEFSDIVKAAENARVMERMRS